MMQITENGIILYYLDETWGSCRHWQIVESIKEVTGEEEAEQIIKNKDRNGFKACFEFERIENNFDDSHKNRHRKAKFFVKTEDNKYYLVKRWDKAHESCNRGSWCSGFIFYLVKDGKVLKEWDLRIKGY